MKIFIINLDRDTARISSLKQQLDAQSLSFERVSAVDASRLSEEEIADFAKRRLLPRRWLKGQIGCFLSHYAIWQKIAASEESYALILEDDVHVSKSLSSLLSDASWLPKEFDIVRIDTSTNRILLTHPQKTPVDGYKVSRLTSTAWCTGGYIISKKACQYLIAQPEASHMATDYFLFCRERSYVARALTVYQIVPALVVQDKFLYDGNEKGFGSNIDIGDSKKTPVFARVSGILRSVVSIPRAAFKTLLGYKSIPYV